MKARCLSALISILATVAFAGGLPDLTLPDGVGVNTHFITGHEQDLEMIAAAGFKWIARILSGRILSAKKANTTGLNMMS
jgi:hypothetical protein